MASLERVRANIRAIGNGNRRNVRLADIEWIVDHLEKNGYKTNRRTTSHSIVFQIETHTFNVCTHHPGNGQIKPCYVNACLAAMVQLGLYED